MKRGEHTFQFPGKAISESALAMAQYHERRIEWWKNEQQQAIETAKAKGVEVRELPVTGGTRVDVVIDPSVQMRLNECASKINQHQAAADRFNIEALAYGTQPDRVYELQPDDVVYFRMVGGVPTEQE